MPTQRTNVCEKRIEDIWKGGSRGGDRMQQLRYRKVISQVQSNKLTPDH